MMRRMALLLLAIVFVGRILAIDVKECGAMGDGVHIDSPAINEAIKQVADAGGGVVTLSEGTYL